MDSPLRFERIIKFDLVAFRGVGAFRPGSNILRAELVDEKMLAAAFSIGVSSAL